MPKLIEPLCAALMEPEHRGTIVTGAIGVGSVVATSAVASALDAWLSAASHAVGLAVGCLTLYMLVRKHFFRSTNNHRRKHE